VNILKEADKITSGARQKAYGSPREGFERTAKMWSAYLGIPIKWQDVPALQILLKMSRLAHQEKRDSLVDVAGYARAWEMGDEL
jgi:hypothetical protein